MSKLDLENPNVFYIEMKRDQLRAFFDGEELGEEFEEALDEAQGYVADKPESFVVLRVTP